MIQMTQKKNTSEIKPIKPIKPIKNHSGAFLSKLLLVAVLALLLTACSTSSSLPPTGRTAPPSDETEALAAATEQAITRDSPDAQQPELPPKPTAEPTMAPATEPAAQPSATQPSTSGGEVGADALVSLPTPQPTQFGAQDYPPPAPGDTPDEPTINSEILFLRNGVLTAYDLDTGQERQLAANVKEFAAPRDGELLALVRSDEVSPDEIWLINRDGSGLRQVTSNFLAEGSLSWAPDGETLVYAASEQSAPRLPDWINWSAWCASSTIHMLDIASVTETALEAGCAPTFSNDGLRIAFATPPQNVAPGMERVDAASQTNAIRLVNREGENGWNFATAGQGGEDGHLVYAPAWSSDNGVVAYHRFVGYRALVDLNYIEMGGSFQGNGDLLYSGAGWLMPPEFAPRSRRMAVVEYNFSDARGWGGYTQWTIRVLQPGQTSEITLPTGTRETDAALVDQLRYGTAAVWAPAGDELLVTLPAGWSADAPTDQPVFQSRTAGELWRWTPGSEPSERLVQQIDFASPLLWLPPL